MDVRYVSALIAVKDVKRSTEFYEKLFGQKVILDLGANVTLEGGLVIQEGFADLVGLSDDEVKTRPNNMELYFETDEFELFLEKLERMPDISYVHPPKTHEWRQRVVRIYDPDGHIIEIGEAMDAVILRQIEQGHTVEEAAKLTQFPFEYVKRLSQSRYEPYIKDKADDRSEF